MISVAGLPLRRGGCEPPRVYGWCAKPVTRSRRGRVQPRSRGRLAGRGPRQSSVRRNGFGATGRVASAPVVRPIGAVSPSSISSRRGRSRAGRRCPRGPASGSARRPPRRRCRSGARTAVAARPAGWARWRTTTARPAAARRGPRSRPGRRRSSACPARARSGRTRRVGLAARRGGACTRGPRRHRQRGGEQELQAARAASPRTRPSSGFQRRGGVRRPDRPASKPARPRSARGDRAPQHQRPHAVGAERGDVVERALARRGARLQQLQVVLDQRPLGRPRRRARRDGERDEQADDEGAHGTPNGSAVRRRRRSARRPCSSRRR